MQVIILHLQAPLMSFGTPQVDQIGPTGEFPTLSQITGLLANALGYTHGAADRLQDLQKRLSIASILVHPGDEFEDYQTVDLGQPHLRDPAWTSRGRTEHREGGATAKYGTHIRRRRYRTDSSALTAASLTPAGRTPTVTDLAAALIAPARPLFIGRAPCLPATQLYVGTIDDAADLKQALQLVPKTFPDRWADMSHGTDPEAHHPAEWPASDDTLMTDDGATTHRVVDQRDWLNQLHGGERVVARRALKLNDPATGHSGDTP